MIIFGKEFKSETPIDSFHTVFAIRKSQSPIVDGEGISSTPAGSQSVMS